MRTEKHPTSQTTWIMTWRGRRFQSQTQQRRRALGREAHRNTRERVREKTVDGEDTTATDPNTEDPVKRRLLKKTDMRNDESVMNVDENLSNVVNTVTKDENVPEANSNEDNEMPKLTVLDDYEEMMKGRQKELNSLKENGCDDSCEKI